MFSIINKPLGTPALDHENMNVTVGRTERSHLLTTEPCLLQAEVEEQTASPGGWESTMSPTSPHRGKPCALGLAAPFIHRAGEAIRKSAIFHSIIRHLSHTFNNQRHEGLDSLNMEVIKLNW